MFWGPDTKVDFTVQRDKLEFCRGKEGGWNLIGNSSAESVKDEGVVIGEMIIGIIAEREQAKGVKVILAKVAPIENQIARPG